ncbi:EscU/YscU/HrcU family type III secretion system export apparatus switch protein [Aquifex sp.]
MKHKKAVALKYKPEEDKAPIVVAKGKGEVAERIIKLAKENGIPIVEDKNLVEALINVDLYEEIPPELYEAVAKLLVYLLKKLN